MQSQEKCIKCSQPFTHTNIAHIVPTCGHNICHNCLKNVLTKKLKNFHCKQCNEDQLVQDHEIQSFPKNITIIKLIRQSSLSASIASQKIEKNVNNSYDTDANSSSMLINDSSKYSQFSDRSSNNVQLCSKHGKPLQIICIEDHGLLCPHCAIFGEHKNHQFKIISEFQEELKNFHKSLKQIGGRKKNADLKIKGQNYKKQIVKQITNKKDELIKEIKQNFAKLAQQLKSAEEKVYDQLVGAFRKIDSQINRMTKQQNKLQKSYEEWKRATYDYISKIQHQRTLSEKVGLFYHKQMPQLKHGNMFVDQIQEKNNGISDTIKSMISSIHMEYSVSIQGYIYNYARVVFNAADLTQKVIDLTPKSKSKQKQNQKKKPIKVQFVSCENLNNNINPSTLSEKRSLIPKPPKSKSPDLKKIRSNPKIVSHGGSKIKMQHKNAKSPKRSDTPNKNDKKIGSQIKQLNLQFAERMLNQFKYSTDTLDITGCELTDNQIVYLVSLAATQKPIKCLKIAKNKLTTLGLKQILPNLLSVTNMNISSNMLSDESVDELIRSRQYMPHLRVVNVSANKLNERKIKSKVEELKRMGIIITL